MTLRLILMRHAKSDWDNPALDDFDRPLNPRGRKAATKIGKWLNTQNYTPDLVLCSEANRTRETCSRVLNELGKEPKVTFLHSLYLAAPESILQELARVQGTGTVMLVAHNPGIAILANALAEHAPAHPRFDDHPSGATGVFEFDCDDWASVSPGTGQVINFVVPRDLA